MKCKTDKIKIWQNELRNAVTGLEELFDLLALDKNLLNGWAALEKFPLKVPRNFIARMRKGDINDPLLRQVLPTQSELTISSNYQSDPLEEKKYNPLPGLLHKYQGRVLLTLSSMCGINCRYCFRKDFAYEKNNPGSLGWEKVYDYIAADKTISEVILSGGDPLVVNDQTLKKITQKLELIPSIKRLRIHTRMPIVLPNRMTTELINAITSKQFKTILVTHCNHPQEINAAVKSAMTRLSQNKITLLNQSVLLRGVNDDVDVLVALSEALYDAGILPYYLHLLDKVNGTAHFDIDSTIARKLHWEMMQRLSGFLVPKLVCEKPGAPAKIPLKLWDQL